MTFYAKFNTKVYNAPITDLPNEYGKIIALTFDLDIRESSLAGNESSFTVSATEKNFIPGGADQVITYTVEDISLGTAKVIKLLIAGWAGFNKATGDISVVYNGSTGSIAGNATGHPQVASFSETFTPTNLMPIDNPGILEYLGAALSDYAMTRILITIEDADDPHYLNTALEDYTLTRTHVDDLPP